MERLYTIPLRKEFQKAPNYKRTSRAIIAIRKFIKRHMKCDNVKIGKELNLEMWKHGRKNPPSKIKVKALKEKIKEKDKEIELVVVNLPSVKIEIQKEKKKKEKKKEEKPKEEVIETKTDEHKIEEEKDKKEVLQKEVVQVKQKDIPGKPKKEPKIKNKPMIIGRTSKK